MRAKTINMMEEDWEYLIVLDACRYDYFSQLYNRFFRGKLERLVSQGSFTLGWCLRNFTSHYPDVIYVSANPYINSKMPTHAARIDGIFDANEHFYKVIDVWDFGWDDRLGTVPPGKVNEAALAIKNKYPSKRLIIHYLQPHCPYVSPKFRAEGFPRPQPDHGIILGGTHSKIKSNRTIEKLFKRLERRLFHVIPAKWCVRITWEIREWLELPPANPMDFTRRMFGVDGLREAYVENLRIVFEHIAILLKELYGSVIITSDHGEFLGEGMKFGHHPSVIDPILREVPWLNVTGLKKTKHRSTVLSKVFKEGEKTETVYAPEEEEEIKKRLKK